jgi:hypothetical protein
MILAGINSFSLHCRYQTLQIRAKPFIRSKQYTSSDKTDTYRFGGFLPRLAIPRFLHPTGWWIYKQYITGITANNYDVYTYNAALHRSPPEDPLAGEHLWKRILAYTHIGRPRTSGTAGTGTARPLCILRRSRKSSPFCRRWWCQRTSDPAAEPRIYTSIFWLNNLPRKISNN